MNYFSENRQRFKSMCDKESCHGCTDMVFSRKKQRWCYDEKYALKSDQKEKVRLFGKVTNVMTGLMSQNSYRDLEGNANDSYNYELNMTRFQMLISTDTYTDKIKRVSEIYNIQSNSLIATLIEELK